MKRKIWGVHVKRGGEYVGTLTIDGEVGPNGKPVCRGFGSREDAETFIREHCPPEDVAEPFEMEIDNDQVVGGVLMDEGMKRDLAQFQMPTVH